MSAYAWLWLRTQSLRRYLALWGWSAFYRVYLRLHPSVKKLGRIEISGRIIWKLDPRGSVEFGDGVRIHSGARFNAFGGHRPCIIQVLPGASLKIGDRVGLSSSTLICLKQIEIESDVRIGGDCYILDSDIHSLSFRQRMQRPDPGVVSLPVKIGSGAFIGGNSMILKGVTIGKKAVVGAGAVVVRDVPAGEIWTGNPARFLRALSADIDPLRTVEGKV